MSSRPRRSVTRMTLEEAERIAALDREGRLDTSEPSVQKVVFEAHRVLQRSAIWGAGPGSQSRRRTRIVLTVVGVFLAIWVVGLLLPLLASL